MPRINLLPWRDEERKERKLKFLVSLGVAALGALVVTGVGYMLMDSMVSAQEARNSRLDDTRHLSCRARDRPDDR